jgi:hypothetical protein
VTHQTQAELLERSDALHTRVQQYIQRCRYDAKEFESLALEIACFQAQANPGYARLAQASGSRLNRVGELPAVPVQAFRYARVATYPPEFDLVRFVTSGTTGAQRGTHAMRRTDTYRAAAITWGRQALLPQGRRRAVVVALMPAQAPSSSLGYMAQMFMDEFGPTDEPANGFFAPSPGWLLTDQGVDVASLEAQLQRARRLNLPLLVLATALALSHLLDALGNTPLSVWPDTVIMPTGGFKGKARQLSAADLQARVAHAFGVDENRVVSEYGMTELSSQLYEGRRPGAQLQSEPGCYLAPPWLHVCPVDPLTLEPVADGSSGVARFVDLANVDSAVCVVTEDVIARRGPGLELLGRLRAAPARGCSLSAEEFFSRSG